jgi:hypothetical protein
MAQSNWNLIAAALETAIEAVVGSGPPVHRGERITLDWNNYLTQFKHSSADRIEGWTIHRKAAPAELLTNKSELIHHEAVLRYIRSVPPTGHEAAEIAFGEALEDVAAIIRQARDLGDVCDLINAPSITGPQFRMFGNTLCYYGEITFTADERASTDEDLTWTQLDIWHVYVAHPEPAFPENGVFYLYLQADLTAELTRGAFELIPTDGGEFDPDSPTTDGVCNYKRGGQLGGSAGGNDLSVMTNSDTWIGDHRNDPEVGWTVNLADLKRPGMIGAPPIATGIAHILETSDTTMVHTVYTPEDLEGQRNIKPDPNDWPELNHPVS